MSKKSRRGWFVEGELVEAGIGWHVGEPRHFAAVSFHDLGPNVFGAVTKEIAQRAIRDPPRTRCDFSLELACTPARVAGEDSDFDHSVGFDVRWIFVQINAVEPIHQLARRGMVTSDRDETVGLHWSTREDAPRARPKIVPFGERVAHLKLGWSVDDQTQGSFCSVLQQERDGAVEVRITEFRSADQQLPGVGTAHGAEDILRPSRAIQC